MPENPYLQKGRKYPRENHRVEINKLDMRNKYDTTKATEVQITNDAYYNLAFNEPCLDEENQEEADEIRSMFPNGFMIKEDSIEPVDGTDMVQIIIIPAIIEDDLYTRKIPNINGPWQYEYYFIDRQNLKIHLRIVNMQTGKTEEEYDTEIVFQYGHYWIRLIDNSLLSVKDKL